MLRKKLFVFVPAVALLIMFRDHLGIVLIGLGAVAFLVLMSAIIVGSHKANQGDFIEMGVAPKEH